MAEVVKETVTTQSTSAADADDAVVVKQVKVAATNTQSVEYLIYFFFGVLEVLLAFRLVFKLAGASMTSGFVRFIYGLTGVFILPFEGIFRRGYAEGVETTSVLEPAALVALVVYAILAWGIVKLVHVLSGEKQPE